jgi:hypothetical protein
MSTVAWRAAPPFGATESETAPSPFPSRPASSWIQSTWLEAVHAQPACVVTLTFNVPPPPPTCPPVAPMSNRQAVAAWMMSTRCSLTTTAPRREEVALLAEAVKRRVLCPCPLVGAISAIQSASARASHVQSRSTVMFT